MSYNSLLHITNNKEGQHSVSDFSQSGCLQRKQNCLQYSTWALPGVYLSLRDVLVK